MVGADAWWLVLELYPQQQGIFCEMKDAVAALAKITFTSVRT